MIFFTTQKDFFDKIDKTKFFDYENNLCGIVDIFIILKNFWINLSENEIFEKSLEFWAYDERTWWKYKNLLQILEYYLKQNNIFYKYSKIFNSKFFHNFRFIRILKNLNWNIVISSIKLDENHLIILEKFEDNFVFYSSVWTKKSIWEQNIKIYLKDFLKIYNKRSIIIKI